MVYEDVFFDRFNSIYKGFYLLVGQQQLAEMIRSYSGVTFIKIPSTERFGSQDVTILEYADPNRLTEDQRKMIYMLNSLIQTNNYRCVFEQV